MKQRNTCSRTKVFPFHAHSFTVLSVEPVTKRPPASAAGDAPDGGSVRRCLGGQQFPDAVVCCLPYFDGFTTSAVFRRHQRSMDVLG
jgi:hypothetical protein